MENIQGGSNAQRIQEIRDERGRLIQQILDGQATRDGKPDCAIMQQIAEKDALLRLLLEMENPMEDYVKIQLVNVEGVWRIFHNVDVGKDDAAPFEVAYVHPDPIEMGGFFEVRIEDLGERWEPSKYDIGIGVIDTTSEGGKNRKEFGFDIGLVSSGQRVVRLEAGDKTTTLDCPDSVFIQGDVVRGTVDMSGEVTVKRNVPARQPNVPTLAIAENRYKIFIGMKNRFEKVSLACNKHFGSICEGLEDFPKEDLRVYVTSINEGSPGYAKGVANGGKHLLRDGMLVRRLREDGRRIVNYQAGCEASIYDCKFGATATLEQYLPRQLIRNRGKLSGNMVTITRRGREEYCVKVKSLLSGHVEKFVGTNAEWQQERDRLLSRGEQFVIDLPTPHGMIQTNNLLITGTKCKTICNMVYGALTIGVEDTNKTPAILVLGGDRSQSIGTISGAVRAYQDLCVVYFDAHNDFRDPDATQYPITHGSPLFFLLQNQLRDAIKVYNDPNTDRSSYSDETRDAISFINSTREGRQYWQDLQNPSVGYRGFNWLQDAAKINAKRMAFIGLRQTEWEAGSGLGSPLVGLFTNLLGLKEGTYPHHLVKAEGVTKIFQRAINQFRGTFEKEYLDKRDEEAKAKGKERWIPPIMVSWDVDSIDPKDMPCTIFQEANGLTSEECLAFADEIASTGSVVLMETIEFNPDLWEGYRDEKVIMTINEFEAGPYARAPREPSDKNKHRLDLQISTKLLQDMIQRTLKPNPICVES